MKYNQDSACSLIFAPIKSGSSIYDAVIIDVLKFRSAKLQHIPLNPERLMMQWLHGIVTGITRGKPFA
jgi:hypothetical protein